MKKLFLIVMILSLVLPVKSIQACSSETFIGNLRVDYVTCYQCFGTGREICPVCGGMGIQPFGNFNNGPYVPFDELSVICTYCGGSGTVTCTVCDGTGKLIENRELN